jgi:hypothetical protein
MLDVKTKYSPPTLRFFGTLDHVRYGDFPPELKKAAERMQRDAASVRSPAKD